MKSRTNQVTRLVIVALVFFMFNATVVIGAEQGVSSNQVRVGASMDMSGPTAFVGKVVSDGIRVYFSAVNAAGGIHGRKVILQTVEDHGYNPSRAVASVAKLNGRDKVFAIVGGQGTPTAMAMVPALQRAGLPMVGIGSFGSRLAYPPKKIIFQTLTLYRDQMRIALDYVVKDLGIKKPKIGLIYQDDELGKDCIDGLKQQAKMYGIPLDAMVSYKRGTVDFSSQVLRMKAAGVEYLFLATIYRETAAVVKTAKKMGWKPTFIINSAATDRITLKLSGIAADGVLGVAIGELIDSQRPGWKTYLERTEKYSKIKKPGFYHSVGYSFAEVFCEGLRLTGRDLTREKFIMAMEKIKNFNTGVGSNITFGPGLRAGGHSAFIVRANGKEGRFEKLTERRDPRDRP
ncbi:MAG: ABC transporter substrate-binding protein [Deltaproteobacteria bacterium]|jgi:branched-chain amino acid transport system substrate-binding protein|nr:ABC transporter substrate-binding protein [Deltaproteobacteria bacterium]MBT6500281.1 ABC transporter substrate-binding protein [Deltaproteobacteria bacterium]